MTNLVIALSLMSSDSTSPLTFDLQQDLYEKLVEVQNRVGANTLSEVIRYAVSLLEERNLKPSPKTSRQVSVRVSQELRIRLERLSRRNKSSLGEILRVALDALPDGLSAFHPETTTTTTMPKKVTKKKAVKKAARKAPAKKAVKKKAPAKKAVKKKAVKKAVKKKAPAKKAVKKKAVKKKAPAKKAVKKKAVKKKAVKKKAAKKAVKKAVKKKAAKKAVKKKAPAKKAVKKKAAKKKTARKK